MGGASRRTISGGMRSVPRDQEGARPRAGQPASVREAAPWHALPAADVLARLGSGPDGLAEAEARGRLARHGPNRLPAARPRGPLRRLLAQFDSLLIHVLLASAAVTLLLGHAVDAAVILGVVVINALVGFVQEGRAEQALDAIRGMLGPEASVLRDGRRRDRPRRGPRARATSCCWSRATGSRPTCGWCGRAACGSRRRR